MATEPERQWCRSFPAASDIRELLKECERHEISDTAVDLLRRLAAHKPRVRLFVNLSVCLGLAADADVDNILLDGLCMEERRVLIELDTSSIPPPLREVAHGLLNVHERWLLWRAMGKSFRTAEAARERTIGEDKGG